jgi:hypothetical protein
MLTVANASDFLPHVLQENDLAHFIYSITDDAAQSTEVRAREPYMGGTFMPFVSPLLYHERRSQSSPGHVEAGEFWG